MRSKMNPKGINKHSSANALKLRETKTAEDCILMTDLDVPMTMMTRMQMLDH
jgi:hypothetical protein